MSEQFVSEQFDDAYPDGIENDFWTIARNRIIYDAIRKHADLSAPVLDVGCGRGITVQFLRQKGVEAFGCEIGSPRIDPSLAPYIKVGTDALQLPAEQRSKVGTILLLDVIEHIGQPEVFLSALIDAFHALRLFIITVPARTELWSNYDTHYGHYRRYDFATLQRGTVSLPVKALCQQYFFHGLYLPLWLQTKVGKARKVQLKAPTRLWLHRLLATVFHWESRLCPKPLPGSSLLGIIHLADGKEREINSGHVRPRNT